MQVVAFNVGEELLHVISGMTGKFASLGHYPDTIMISIPSNKNGESRRNIEVYAKHVQKVKS